MKSAVIRAIALLLILLSAAVFAVSCKDKDDEDNNEKAPSGENDGGTEEGEGDAPIIDEDGNFNGGGYVGEWDTEDFQ